MMLYSCNRYSSSTSLLALILCILALLVSNRALGDVDYRETQRLAQSGSDQEPQVFSQENPDPSPEASPDWSIQLGALLIRWPEYTGSDAMETPIYPLFDFQYRNRFFLNYSEGIGIHLLHSPHYAFDASIGYEPGRAEDDSTRLQGLGDIDAGASIRLGAEYLFGAFALGAKYIDQVSGDNTGYRIDFEASHTRVIAGKLILKPAVIARFVGDDYSMAYFGVSERQSVDSELPVYQPDAGFSSAGAQLSVVRFLENRWFVQAQLKLERLLGDAADSPIVFDENQFTMSIGLARQIR